MCQRVTLEATNLYTCQNKSWDHYMCMIPTVIGCKTYEYLRQNYKCIDRNLIDDLQMLVSFQILNDMR